jgi:flavin reductase (DIM6/NTAB) family NADH-FMN oxidoreductase RutF
VTLEPLPDDVARETLAYRRALGAFPTGVCVVTADTPEGPLGITVNSFASVSLEPRLVLWCLDERSERWPVFAAAECFAIHVLPAGDQGLAVRFARGVCRLEPGEFVRVGEGPPGLPEALARFDCATHERIQMGDHMIVVGRVERFEARGGEALTFYRGRYGSQPEPQG